MPYYYQVLSDDELKYVECHCYPIYLPIILTLSILLTLLLMQSDTPSPRDFEDYHDFPYPNEMFDKAGMQALLEEEYLNNLTFIVHAQSPEEIDFSSHPETM